MAQSIEFFRERARESAEEARTATLANVRERALRSEAAWRDMAERAVTVAENRAELARRRDNDNQTEEGQDDGPERAVQAAPDRTD